MYKTLRNIWKRANASKAEISMSITEDGAIISVVDDGNGFRVRSDTEFLTTGKLGLMGMKERAHLVGGILEIESAPDNGTTLTLHIPHKYPGRNV